MPVVSWNRRWSSDIVSMLHSLASLYAFAPSKSAPSICSVHTVTVKTMLALAHASMEASATAGVCVGVHNTGRAQCTQTTRSLSSAVCQHLSCAVMLARVGVGRTMAVVSAPRPALRPLRSPRLAFGGTLPATVLVLPVTAMHGIQLHDSALRYRSDAGMVNPLMLGRLKCTACKCSMLMRGERTSVECKCAQQNKLLQSRQILWVLQHLAQQRASATPEPTMTQRGLPLGLFCRSSSSRLTSKKCDRWFTPALSSNPSAVNRGSCRTGLR